MKGFSLTARWGTPHHFSVTADSKALSGASFRQRNLKDLARLVRARADSIGLRFLSNLRPPALSEPSWLSDLFILLISCGSIGNCKSRVEWRVEFWRIRCGWLDAEGRRRLGSVAHEIPLEKMAAAGGGAGSGRCAGVPVTEIVG